MKSEFYVLRFLPVLFVMIFLSGVAQVKYSINGQYMSRAEYRHGFSTLDTAGQKAAFFISQRARLTASLSFNKVEMYMSLQDIRTWGSAGNLPVDNNGFLSIHEAWASVPLNKKFNIKVGRQEIAYDEDRIFGSLDWAMQARRHDAALLRFYDSASNTTLHIGVAFNQNSDQQLAGIVYTVPNNYKTFQYLYVSRPFGKVTTSFLFLNNGIQYDQSKTNPAFDTTKTVFSQTFGPRFSYKDPGKKLSGNLAFYYQAGKNNKDQSLSGYNFSTEVAYQLTKKFSLTTGMEILSGTDEVNLKPAENKSFTPFYGTNHRFNGYMDYFYVNNHANSVGLQNIYVKGLLKFQKVFLALDYHHFTSAAKVKNDVDPALTTSNSLGSEIDFTLNYNYSNGVAVQMGYSQMFATQTMEFLKNVPSGSGQTNNWAYLMLIIRPNAAWPRTGLKL